MPEFYRAVNIQQVGRFTHLKKRGFGNGDGLEKPLILRLDFPKKRVKEKKKSHYKFAQVVRGIFSLI